MRADVWRDRIIGGKEPLGVSCGLKPLQAPFPLAGRLVGVFSPVVEVAVLSVFHPRQHLPLRGTIALQVIGDDHAWDMRTAVEEPAEDRLGGDPLAPSWHQDLEHGPVLVDGVPQTVPFAVDGEEHVIQVPCVTGACQRGRGCF